MRRLLTVSFFLRSVPSALILLPLLLLFFSKLAFTHLILARGDTFLYFYPYWDYRARTLLAGHLPLWNPYLFMGAPFLANSQAGVLYPLNWPLAFFPAPVAVEISILLHLAIAALGAHAFARRALAQSASGAFLSAALFSLGGYLTAQIEHVNQLQVLAWFPWLLLAVHKQYTFPRGLASGTAVRTGQPFARHTLRLAHYALRLVPCALCLALQLLAGHTQSTFISLVGATLYALSLAFTHTPTHSHTHIPTHPHTFSPRRLTSLFLYPSSFFLALLLSSAQLLPTLELSQNSLRSGGLALRDALSFSLDPRLIGRALLPGYSRGLFSEYVAYIGVAGLALAAHGSPGARKTAPGLGMLVLAGIGLAFALGAFNPVYALLAGVPPFNLFRVPARWLFLFAFGAAMLAGHGLDELSRQRLGPWALGLGIFLILISPLSNNLVPAGETGPVGLPSLRDIVAWLLPLALLAAIMLPRIRLPNRLRTLGILWLAVSELFLAAQVLPYNHLTSPEAYSSVRPAMTQLLAQTAASAPSHDPSAASRFLSLSALRFDPGDLAELHGELDAQLVPDAVYDFVVATKHKEVLSPNLPLAWGVPAVDGYDGGILPLANYAAFTDLFTGAPSKGADGRLRENLTALPDPRLLSLVNVRYLITDKVGDAWIDDVFYDLQFTLTLSEGNTSSIAHVPQFQATALGLVADSHSGQVSLTFADGSSADLPITSSRVRFDRPATPVTITLAGPLAVSGLSLIDERTGAFQSLTLGNYRLVHSGDVKIYENLAVLPRAFVAPQAVVITDDAAARAALADPTFDPASTLILASAPFSPVTGDASRSSVARPASITHYSPERVSLLAQGPGYLLLTDAYYPGWHATVDGLAEPILRADLMFRAVELPPGLHTVEFRFEPVSVRVGLWISGLTWASVIVLLIFTRYLK